MNKTQCSWRRILTEALYATVELLSHPGLKYSTKGQRQKAFIHLYLSLKLN